jgi:hypothetical protein
VFKNHIDLIGFLSSDPKRASSKRRFHDFRSLDTKQSRASGLCGKRSWLRRYAQGLHSAVLLVAFAHCEPASRCRVETQPSDPLPKCKCGRSEPSRSWPKGRPKSGRPLICKTKAPSDAQTRSVLSVVSAPGDHTSLTAAN